MCASDSMPVLCPPQQTNIDDDVGDVASCHGAQTVRAPFDSRTNATRGQELQRCANGCQAMIENGITIGARCR